MQSGADGRYRAAGLQPAPAWVSTGGDSGATMAPIHLDGWSSHTVNLTIAAPAGYRYVVVTQRLLDKQFTATTANSFGRVLDESGDGLNGVVVEMAWTGATPNTQFPRVATTTPFFQADGQLRVFRRARSCCGWCRLSGPATRTAPCRQPTCLAGRGIPSATRSTFSGGATAHP